MKRLDEALAASGRAFALAYGPRKIRVLAQRATILEAQGDAAGAKNALRDAIAYAATLPKAQQNPRLVERIDVIEGHQLQPGNPGTVKYPA